MVYAILLPSVNVIIEIQIGSWEISEMTVSWPEFSLSNTTETDGMTEQKPT